MFSLWHFKRVDTSIRVATELLIERGMIRNGSADLTLINDI